MNEINTKEKQWQKFDLKEHLLDFAVLIIQISERMNNSHAGNHIDGQIVHSGTHPA